MRQRRNHFILALIAAGAFALALHGTRTAAGAAASCPDADNDGHQDWSCGGDDCDDSDGYKYPGNAEVCDSAGHDEDCDPYTIGYKDDDRDGETDLRCLNHAPDGTTPSGTDGDDSNPAIHSGAQVCNGGDQVYVYGRGFGMTGGSTVAPRNCPTGTKCIPQPNGTAICGTPPPGYVAPAVPPPAPTPRALPSHTQLLSALRGKKRPSLAPVKGPMLR